MSNKHKTIANKGDSARKKMGRPIKEVTKNVIIAARFSPDEAQRIYKAGDEHVKGRSEWVRETLLEKAKEKI